MIPFSLGVEFTHQDPAYLIFLPHYVECRNAKTVLRRLSHVGGSRVEPFDETAKLAIRCQIHELRWRVEIKMRLVTMMRPTVAHLSLVEFQPYPDGLSAWAHPFTETDASRMDAKLFIF
jgi:hypothetical protein